VSTEFPAWGAAPLIGMLVVALAAVWKYRVRGSRRMREMVLSGDAPDLSPAMVFFWRYWVFVEYAVFALAAIVFLFASIVLVAASTGILGS